MVVLSATLQKESRPVGNKAIMEPVTDRVILSVNNVKQVLRELRPDTEFYAASEKFYLSNPGHLCQCRIIFISGKISFDFCVRMGAFDDSIKWPLHKKISFQIISKCSNRKKPKVLTIVDTATISFLHICKPLVESGNVTYKHEEFIDVKEYMEENNDLEFEIIIS